MNGWPPTSRAPPRRARSGPPTHRSSISAGVLATACRATPPAVFSRYQSGWGEAIKQAGSLKGLSDENGVCHAVRWPAVQGQAAAAAAAVAQTPVPARVRAPAPLPTSPSAAISGAALGLFNKLHKKDDSQQQAAPEPGGAGHGADVPDEHRDGGDFHQLDSGYGASKCRRATRGSTRPGCGRSSGRAPSRRC